MNEIGPVRAGSDRPRASRRGVVGAILYLCLLAAGVFVGWQLHGLLYKPAPTVSAPPDADTFRAAGRSERPASSPAELVSSPLAASGLREFDGDPGGIAPPPAARRLAAFERQSPGLTQQQARYEWEGTTSDAAEFYRRQLEQRQFKLLRPVADDTDGEAMLFLKDRLSVNLSLKQRPRNDKIVIIVLVHTSGSN